MKYIFVATFEDSSGGGYQKIFSSRKLADNWLWKMYIRSFDEPIKKEFIEWKRYGAFTAKIKRFKLI